MTYLQPVTYRRIRKSILLHPLGFKNIDIFFSTELNIYIIYSFNSVFFINYYCVKKKKSLPFKNYDDLSLRIYIALRACATQKKKTM